MGLNVTLKLDRLGFYPAGGGKMRALIAPAKLTPIEILARGEIHRRTVRILLANLPEHVAEREIRAIRQRAAWPKSCFQVETISNSPGPGNVVMIEIASESVTEIFTGFGERGVRAEAVAKQALEPALHYGAAAAPVGEHLADQLLLPLALARAGAFLTLPLSPHSLTNLEVIRLFLGISPELQADEDNNCLVRFGA
jgi:RNA 3'-terminal phosphate cyclase (ATP)